MRQSPKGSCILFTLIQWNYAKQNQVLK